MGRRNGFPLGPSAPDFLTAKSNDATIPTTGCLSCLAVKIERAWFSSIRSDCANSDVWLRQLDRSSLRCQIGADKLGLYRLGYPVGRSRLSYHQPDQRDRKQQRQSKKSYAPASLHAVFGFAGSVERTMHGCLHRAEVPHTGIAQGVRRQCDLLHIRRGIAPRDDARAVSTSNQAPASLSPQNALIAFGSRFGQRFKRRGIEHDDGPVFEANPVARRPDP
jgi:hypothetical protein